MQKIGAPMLEGEFLAELRALRLEWHLSGQHAIRTYRRIDSWFREVCPLGAVYVSLIGGCIAIDGTFAGWGLGIPADLTKRLIAAADQADGHDEILRRRLLKAVDL